MIRIASFLLIFFGLAICQLGCSVLKHKQALFQIKEAYYQSWHKNDSENGTMVFLKLVNVRDGIEFDSIVFRGRSLPLVRSQEANVTKLNANIIRGIPRISDDSRADARPDQLLYKFAGKRYSYLLTLQRKDIQYLK